MKHRIGRRDFLRSAGAAGIVMAATAGMQRTAIGNTPSAEEALRGFIVSDAHFGWQHETQPASGTIREMMGRILRRFPDLDVFIDTGDAHHSGAPDEARGEWTDIILSGCGPLPFYYVPGNHEIMGWGGGEDVEMRCNRLGSISCRPYYSFDIKGIHFISLPELMMVCYVTNEALEWMALDLALNRDKTTIVLSHNSIAGTTEPHDDLGYRRLANSAQIFDFLNQYPNIVAWMHGHNHTWEVVQRKGKFYVSNGRIGGFDPPYAGYYGRGHLGGIYFEVCRERVTVRGFSASQDCFFDEIDHYAHLTQSIETTTSLDPAAPPCLSYGFGGMRDGQRMPVFNHHAGPAMTQELFLAGAEGPVFNENPAFNVCSRRTLRKEHTRLLPGYAISPGDRKGGNEESVWIWENPGIRLHPHPRKGGARVSVPRPGEGRFGYYRCAPGNKYRMGVELESGSAGPRVQCECLVYDAAGKLLLALKDDEHILRAGAQSLEAIFSIPELKHFQNIYTNPELDAAIQVNFLIECRELDSSVLLRKVAISFADASASTIAPSLSINGRRYGGAENSENVQPLCEKLADRARARSVVEAGAGGNRRLTWLIRQHNIAWQVRNAPVTDLGDSMEIGPLRNAFSPRKEIVIAPFKRTADPFVHRLRCINRARIRPFQSATSALTIDVVELLGEGEIEVMTTEVPKSIQGAENYEYADGRLVIRVGSPGTIVIV